MSIFRDIPYIFSHRSSIIEGSWKIFNRTIRKKGEARFGRGLILRNATKIQFRSGSNDLHQSGKYFWRRFKVGAIFSTFAKICIPSRVQFLCISFLNCQRVEATGHKSGDLAGTHVREVEIRATEKSAWSPLTTNHDSGKVKEVVNS